MTITHILTAAANWSVVTVCGVWLGTAVWFAAVRQDTLPGKIRHFFGTLLPEPWMMLGIVVVIAATHAVPHSLWDHVSWSEPILAGLGSVLVIASAILMVWARLALGTMWAGRPMIQQEHELRTGGPYRVVRHPIYTGLIGLVAGGSLMAGFGGSIVTVLFVVIWLLWRVRVEDRMLTATFGDRYRAYQDEVSALVPLPRRLTRV